LNLSFLKLLPNGIQKKKNKLNIALEDVDVLEEDGTPSILQTDKKATDVRMDYLYQKISNYNCCKN
jgi:hypothetical protein